MSTKKSPTAFDTVTYVCYYTHNTKRLKIGLKIGDMLVALFRVVSNDLYGESAAGVKEVNMFLLFLQKFANKTLK